MWRSHELKILEAGERSDDALALKGDVDDREQQVKDIAGLTLLLRPRIGVIHDTAILVGRDLVALDDPVNRTLPIDHVVISLEGDARDNDTTIIMYGIALSLHALREG